MEEYSIFKTIDFKIVFELSAKRVIIRSEFKIEIEIEAVEESVMDKTKNRRFVCREPTI